MIFTEREAAAKRCTPISIVRLMERDAMIGLQAMGELSFNCIGSQCAQWRWHDSPNYEGQSFFIPQNIYAGKGQGRANGAYTHPAPARGYCGMAGRIE
jgi:hypothetical protein